MRVLAVNALNPILWQRPKYWDVISVCRESELPITALCRRHCHVNCCDLRESDLQDPGVQEQIARGRRIPPNRQHVEAALDFAREVGLDRLIVHCAQGVSRSPGIAWFILADHLGSIDAAIDALFHLRPQANPNELIIRAGLTVIRGTNEEAPEVLKKLRFHVSVGHQGFTLIESSSSARPEGERSPRGLNSEKEGGVH